MGLAKKLAVAAVGITVAAGADSGIANSLYDLVHQATSLDPYYLEEFTRAVGTATALGASGAAVYQGIRDCLRKFAKDTSKLPEAAAALGLAGMIALSADTNTAYEVYDALMLYRFNFETISKLVKTTGEIGTVAAGLLTVYHGVKDIITGISAKFSTKADE